VIDYIFRDLAISYLKRTELGQIKPEDLLPTGTKNDLGGSAEDQGRQEKTSAGFRPHGSTGSTAARPAAGHKPSPAVSAAEQSELQKIAQARIKGYEGDPCPACGSFTLVRNGTCMKCDTCGGTTGCS
jgi:ribonucleoside-diphosphate reductase alpha chain